MQGTVLILMALSGVGCHHKAHHGYAPVLTGCYAGYESACYASYEPACYAEPVVLDGCYGAACYSGGYGAASLSACYGDIYDACYSVPACYGGYRKHRHGGLFGCFKRKRCGACNGGYAYDSCYSAPVFGVYPPATYGDTVYGASQIYGSGQVYGPGQTWGAAPMAADAVPAATTTTEPAYQPTNAVDSAAPTPPTPDAATPPATTEPAPVDRVNDAAGAAADAVRDAVPAAPAPEAAPAIPPAPGGF